MTEPAREQNRGGIRASLGTFSELVAAPTPTPGGGSVAAHSGCLAASLGLMVCGITGAKPKFAEAHARISEISAELDSLARRLAGLVEEDAASFEGVMSAYRMPKQTEEEKAERAAAIEAASRRASEVPLETARLSGHVLRLLSEVARLGAPSAKSDVTVGGQLAMIAVRGALYNVAANLPSISDIDVVNKFKEEMTTLRAEADETGGRLDAELLAGQ